MAISVDSTRCALENLRKDLSVPVHAWDIEVGLDATEDPAIWVWATLEDQYLDDLSRKEVRDQIRKAIREMSEQTPWVYVRFRSRSEVE